MKILFTGGSSFTGFWFVTELARAGHDVVAIFRKPADKYDEDLRSTRVQNLSDLCRCVHGCTFGDDRFLDLIREENSWDLLCHHAADVTGYKSPDFDVQLAVTNNTKRLTSVMDELQAKGCSKIVLTGSVFENGEGAGSDGLPAFSPYGLSKAMTAQIFRYYASVKNVRLGKFVIPNPFGPFEEPRFTNYLVRCWYEGKAATVNTPDYVRDNIHISLLAKAYLDFSEQLESGPDFQQLNPAGYPASQGTFAQMFADQMRDRLALPCEVDLKQQTEFTEPCIRINTDALDKIRLGWNEDEAWNDLASYYRTKFSESA